MPRGGRTIALAVLLALGGATVAAAAAAREGEALDDRGDVAAGGLDLVRVALVKGADGRLRGELTMSGPWDAAALRGDGHGPPASACVRLYVDADPTADAPDYLVCATPAADGDSYRGRILRDPVDGPPRTVGRARVSRPTSRTLYLRFTRTAIGRPASVRFAAEVTVPRSSCPAPLGCRDLAPEPPNTVKVGLRGRTSTG